ncbi:MAG TPA: LytTR family DNA-binding domain-containing protein [Anaerovoracaceae bacterium]|nr:LytTR family DNA-binding domain-containing protein [Anaerovoracaceae bacterium]
MLKIAVCDDNIADLSNMVSLIGSYQASQRDKNTIKFTAFHSAVDLIAAMESGQLYDLVLLDILMPFLTGMDAAKEIRQFNQDVKIIFMTSSPEFAVESYSVDAFYYALKPIWKEKLFILLDKVISESEIKLGISLLIKSKTGLTRLYISRLEFVEVIGRTILYHLTDGSVIEAIGSMNEIEKELLSNPCFIKTHRSYIINMDQIDTISQREIKMQSHALVPLAKANYSTVKSAYITFAFKE